MNFAKFLIIFMLSMGFVFGYEIIGANASLIPGVQLATCTGDHDMYISNITPSVLIVDETNEIKCYFRNNGPKSTNTAQIDVRLRVLDEDDDVVSDTKKTVKASSYPDSNFMCMKEYSATFEFEPEDTIEYTLECSLVSPVGLATDANAENDIATRKVDAGYDFDLETNADTDDDEYYLGQIIEIDCDYENKGDSDVEFDDSDTEILLKVKVDGHYVDDCEWNITKAIENNDDGTKSCDYKIDVDYDDDEIDVECIIDYNPEGDDEDLYIDNDEDNDKDEITVDVDDSDVVDEDLPSDEDTYNPPTGIDLALVSLDVTQPVVKDRLSAVSCIAQNIGSLTATGDYYIRWFLDGQLVHKSKVRTEDLSSYEYASPYIYNHIFRDAGRHTIRCDVTYSGTEITSTNNYKEKAYDVILESEAGAGGSSAGELDIVDTVVGSEENVYILSVKEVVVNSYKNGKAEVTCIYENSGRAPLEDYQIMMTHRDKVIETKAFAEDILPGQSKSYETTLNIGYGGGIIGCAVRPLNSSKSAAQYTSVPSESKLGVILTVVSVLVIIGLIIYLVVKTD